LQLNFKKVDNIYIFYHYYLAQETSGKTGGVIGPTKIYLAITPQNSSQPPPLAPVQTVSR
jgi:hypothetical protein